MVITDTILNHVTLNWKKGKRTHIFIDEFHVVFENEQSGIFFNSAWRQFRKRNYYLKHSFEKQYSDYGVPYVQENYDLGLSDNCVIYGHHMNNGSMREILL